MNLNFKVIKKSNRNMARLGEFTTKWGVSKTPMFMPVGTQATVKTLNPEELRDAHANVVLSNTYHLWLRPGEDVVNKAGGLHEFMNFRFLVWHLKKISRKKEFILRVILMVLSCFLVLKRVLRYKISWVLILL